MAEVEEHTNSEYDDIMKDVTEKENESQDSFNKDIMQLYEEHKKVETKLPHRPISSYHHHQNTNNNVVSSSSNKLDSLPSVKNKPQSAHIITNSQNYSNSPTKSYSEWLLDLNAFLQKNKITKKAFIENENIFMSFEDFKALLQGIHYNIGANYAKIWFNYNNENGNKDNYLQIKRFLRDLTFYKYSEISNWSESIASNTNNNISLSQSKVSTGNAHNKSVYEIKYWNEEFTKFNQDITQILKNQTKPSTINYQNKQRIQTAKRGNVTKYTINSQAGEEKLKQNAQREKCKQIGNQSFSNPTDETINQIEQLNQKNKVDNPLQNSQQKQMKTKKYKPAQAINQHLRKKAMEEEKIKREFLERDKNYQKECILKAAECTKMSQILKENIVYSINQQTQKLVIEEPNNINKYESISEVYVIWRILDKKYQQRNIKDQYSTQSKEKVTKEVDANAQYKNEKKERLKEIKEVLIETVRLKTKWKKQWDSLKSSIKIEENVVLEHLKKAGMEIDETQAKKDEVKTTEEEVNKQLVTNLTESHSKSKNEL